MILLKQILKMSDPKVLVLIDADVLIHLLKADKVTLLNILFPDRIRVLDIVLTELLENRTVRSTIENIFIFKQAQEIKFPQNLFGEFASLKDTIRGPGERATLVYCRHNSHIIASSNTKDIVPYCKAHGMCYLTTLDIFCIAVNRIQMTDTEANACIKVITKNNESYLCCESIQDHRKHHFDPNKLLY